MKLLIKNIWLVAAVSIIAVGVTGCTDNFEEINTDPNKVVVGQVSPYNMFEKLLYDGANNRCYDTWYYAGEIVQYTASVSTNVRIGTYTDLNNKFFDRVWSLFCNHGANAAHMYSLAEKDRSEACKAVALTLKVMNMEEVTAMFGDIPYSEAFQARVNGNVTPVFDPQKEVYMQMFDELEAANEIYAASPKFSKVEMDGMYGGDMAKWRRFNNSLYLRLLCRVSNRDDDMDGFVSAKLQEIVNDPTRYPVFTSNADNATVKYTGSTPYANYFYNSTFDSYTNVRQMSQEMVKQLVETDESSGSQVSEDPRARVYFYKNTSSGNTEQKWFGAIAGASPSQMDLNPSYRGILCAPVFCDGTAPYTFMDYAEVQMILAEMAVKGLITGGDVAAKKYYEESLRASCRRWAERLAKATKWEGSFSKVADITEEEIETFISSPLASWDYNSDKRKLIGNQKYILLFQNSYQAFYEIQRTGYPELTIGEGTGSNNYMFPTRMSYPTNTIGTNPHNAAAAIACQGWKENNMREHMWYSLVASGASK